MTEIPLSSATLADMKTRIADELGQRTDLTTQIANAIQDAITFYQPVRFLFNESRDMTFNTVIGQEFYTASDNANIPTLKYFDYLILYLGSIPWPLHRRQPIDIERLNQNGLMRGQPWNFCYYNKQLRLGPVPDGVYQMRIAGQVMFAAPATDTEASNPWMIDAELLIRCRAKAQVYKHVIHDLELAAVMVQEEAEALDQLKGQTSRLVGTGIIEPMVF